MNQTRKTSVAHADQRGVTLLVVLVMLSVMLLGAMSLARLSDVRTLLTGNLTFKEQGVQASEAGVNTAYAAVKALASEESNIGGWYFATQKAPDANGLPTGVDWTNAVVAPVGTGPMEVRYVVERLCSVTPVTDLINQCLLRRDNATQSAKAGQEAFDPLSGRQFRITVRVQGNNDSGKLGTTYVQALVTKGG
jgi:type IV pilus assembly protein PilX